VEHRRAKRARQRGSKSATRIPAAIERVPGSRANLIQLAEPEQWAIKYLCSSKTAKRYFTVPEKLVLQSRQCTTGDRGHAEPWSGPLRKIPGPWSLRGRKICRVPGKFGAAPESDERGSSCKFKAPKLMTGCRTGNFCTCPAASCTLQLQCLIPAESLQSSSAPTERVRTEELLSLGSHAKSVKTIPRTLDFEKPAACEPLGRLCCLHTIYLWSIPPPSRPC